MGVTMARREKAKGSAKQHRSVAKVLSSTTSPSKAGGRLQVGGSEGAALGRTAVARARKAPVAKISVSLGAAEEKWAREKAAATGRSFSAVLNDALRRERQNEARLRLLEELGTSDISPEDLAAVRAEWRK
jgi:hypothetical protein